MPAILDNIEHSLLPALLGMPRAVHAARYTLDLSLIPRLNRRCCRGLW